MLLGHDEIIKFFGTFPIQENYNIKQTDQCIIFKQNVLIKRNKSKNMQESIFTGSIICIV